MHFQKISNPLVSDGELEKNGWDRCNDRIYTLILFVHKTLKNIKMRKQKKILKEINENRNQIIKCRNKFSDIIRFIV